MSCFGSKSSQDHGLASAFVVFPVQKELASNKSPSEKSLEYISVCNVPLKYHQKKLIAIIYHPKPWGDAYNLPKRDT